MKLNIGHAIKDGCLLSWDEMNKRLKFAFDDLEKQMRASDFWKPLFTKPKRKK